MVAPPIEAETPRRRDYGELTDGHAVGCHCPDCHAVSIENEYTFLKQCRRYDHEAIAAALIRYAASLAERRRRLGDKALKLRG